MSLADQQRWDARYAGLRPPEVAAPNPWLVQAALGLQPGRALELACGLGHNAVWLALQGWQVDAVDISSVGLGLAAHLAARSGARVNWIQADLETADWPAGPYDLIAVFRYLDRALLPARISRALAPAGRLVYETFTRAEARRPGSRVSRPDYLLEPGELPRLFPELRALHYEELELPDRCVARLLAARPADS